MMGSLIPFCPKAKCDDGLLDLIIIWGSSLTNTLSIFNKAHTANHIDNQVVEHYQVKSYTVEPQGKSKTELMGEEATNIDGELVGWAPFTATCIPAALKIIVGK